MRKNVRDFIRMVSEELFFEEPIYEFGAFQVTGQGSYADLRSLFPGKKYVGCDMRKGHGVDKIINLHQIDLPDDSVGSVLCCDTLEHVEFPHRALRELYRVLCPDGLAVLSSVMNFPVHCHPNDFWRFTPEGFRSILSPFDNSFIGFQGDPLFPHTVVGIGFKGRQNISQNFLKQYDVWQKKDRWDGIQLVLKICPPFFLPVIKKLYRRLIR